MMFRNFSLFLVLFAISTVGCGGGVVQTKLPAEKQGLIYIASAYSAYWAEHKGKGPASVDELRPILKQFGDPDELLVSSRDGQPFEIKWGLDSSVNSGSASQILAVEKVGLNGVRQAINSKLLFEELTGDSSQ